MAIYNKAGENALPELAQLKSDVDALKAGGSTGAGWTSSQIFLLKKILQAGVYSTDVSSDIIVLCSSLEENASSGGGDTPPTPPVTAVTVTKSGSTLIISGVNAITNINKSGSTLTLA